MMTTLPPSTVPNPMGSVIAGGDPQHSFTLPFLKNSKVQYVPVPRRYEQTKMMIHQEFTHHKIIDLGKEIHQRTLAQCNEERKSALKENENAIWRQAEVIKQKAVDAAINELQENYEILIKRLKKDHKKHLQSEISRVREEMTEEQDEMLASQKADDEMHLEEVKKQTEERLAAEYAKQQEIFKEQEKLKIKEAIEKAIKNTEEKFQVAMVAAEHAHNEALQTQKRNLQLEQEYAVAHVHSREQVKTAKKISELKASHEEKIAQIKKYVEDIKDMLGRTKENLDQEISLRCELIDELIETRQEFRRFIDQSQPFLPGDSGYVLPPVRSLDEFKYLENPNLPASILKN